MMGNYSEKHAIFTVRPVTIIQSLQICGKRMKRGEMGGGGGRTSNKEEKRWKGISSGGGGGGDLQCSFRFNKGKGSFKIVFFFCFFPSRENLLSNISCTLMASDRLLTQIPVISVTSVQCLFSFMPENLIVIFLRKRDAFERSSSSPFWFFYFPVLVYLMDRCIHFNI